MDPIEEAERDAIRLRQGDTDKVLFWLWPPFGPSEERERQLLAPPPAIDSLLNHYGQSQLSELAQYQQSFNQQHGLSNYQAAALSGFNALFGFRL